jgi:hypothetical protein
MKKFLLCAALLLIAPTYADEAASEEEQVQAPAKPRPKKPSQRCQLGECDEGDDAQNEEEESPFRLPHERAWPYDEELETPTTWPGKREDSFYDWLTR